MDDFRLDCVTIIKTHDEELGVELMGSYFENEATKFGRVISYNITDGLECVLYEFKLTGEKA